MATRREDLYEQDFYQWIRAQARALRRLAASHPNVPIDIPHLALEIRDLGKSECCAVGSRIARIVEHAMELAFSPAEAPRAGWIDTIEDARRELFFKLSPSLRRDAAVRLPDLFDYARRQAARTLARHSEPIVAAALPETCPWTLAQILDETWLPEGGKRPSDHV
jgi:hypothetical protein